MSAAWRRTVDATESRVKKLGKRGSAATSVSESLHFSCPFPSAIYLCQTTFSHLLAFSSCTSTYLYIWTLAVVFE